MSHQDPQRRQVTVVFCDLVDSATLVERLDPEVMRDLMKRYQELCARHVEHEDGQIYRFAGDGIVARFGYPISSDNNAERALRASLAITASVHAIDLPEEASRSQLQVRIGIATGIAVVSELRGDGPKDDVVVVGEAPTLAARLQSLAEPNHVVVCETSWRHASKEFIGRSIGRPVLKGFHRQLEVFDVVARRESTQVTARTAAQLHCMVGRDAELRVLKEHWQRAAGGRGSSLCVMGEAGIGKSRLLHALINHVLERNGRDAVIVHHGSEWHTATQLFPVIREMELNAGIFTHDSESSRSSKIDQFVKKEFHELPDASAFIRRVILQNEPAPEDFAGLSSCALRHRSLNTLAHRLARGRANTPRLVVFEDVHWMDATTMTLIEHIIDVASTEKLLIVLTQRTEASVAKNINHQSKQILLERLSQTEAAELLFYLAKQRRLPPNVVELVLERSDGVPLFLEESIANLLETGRFEENNGALALRDESDVLDIPSTLRDSLTARLDRLGGARTTAQIAAAIGRSFDKNLLRLVVDQDAARTNADLSCLLVAAVIKPVPEGLPGYYEFKHAMVQEIAYSTILRASRPDIHLRIATAIERNFPGVARLQPETVARHWAAACKPRRSLDYWHSAGSLAARRSAHREAQIHINRGLDAVSSVEDPGERDEFELKLRTMLGPSLIAVEGYLSDSVEQAYTRAHELCERTGNTMQSARVLRGLWAHHLVSAQLLAAQDCGEQLLRVAQNIGGRDLQSEAHRILGQTHFFQGRFRDALAQLYDAVSLYDQEQSASNAVSFGNETLAVSYSYIGWSLWFLGETTRALDFVHRSIEQARRTKHPFTIAQVLADSMYVYALCRDPKGAHARAAETVEYSTAQAFPYWQVIGQLFENWANVNIPRDVDRCLRMQDDFVQYQKHGVIAQPWFQCLVAQSFHEIDRSDEAAEKIEQGIALIERSGERFAEPELHRLRGEFMARHDATAAEQSFAHSLRCARDLRAIAWELRCATSLARHWMNRKRRSDAIGLLEPVVNRLPEGLHTPDVDDALRVIDTTR